MGPMAEPRNFYELLRGWADREPSRILFHYQDRRIAYGRVLTEVDALAGALARRGVKKGDTFAIILRNSPDFVVAYAALSRLGAVAVPLNFMVTKAPELAFLLRDSRAVGLLTEKEFFKNYEPLRAGLPSLRIWLGTDVKPEGGAILSELVDEGLTAPERGPSAAEPDDVACILYTSGTTGKPKGAMLSHHNILSNALAMQPVSPGGRRQLALDILPFFHTFGWQAGVVAPMVQGASLLIFRSVTPPRPWLSAMGRYGATFFAAVPQIYSVLSREAVGFKRLYLKWFAFRSVRVGVSAAAPLTEEVRRTFEERLGVPLYEGYGLTETGPVVALNMPEARKNGTVGRPLPGVQVRVVDDQEKDVPRGQAGEICVQGPNVMKGYFNNPEATREAFTADGRWLKTGDIGFIDEEGYLTICDRKKDMIIVKGLKVFSAQVEEVIAEHPAVAEAAVVGVADPATGDETIRAYVVLKEGAKAEKGELLAFIKGKLDPYKRPRDIEILSALPKNALQKVLKYELRKRAAAG